MKRPTPTGEKAEFTAGELFFSTTDDAGHIASANDVFVRLSRYSRDQLRGAPHSIIRHPDMPSGVYYAMWQAIQARKPFAGYIRNLSSDGAHYDVFATVTSLPTGGYLSVRSLPMVEDTASDMWGIYADIVAREQEARAGGASASEAARIGAEALEAAVQELGYSGYAQFQRKALLREVTRREEALEGSLGLVVTNTIDLVVRAALGLHAEVSVLSVEHESLEDLTRHIDASLGRISASEEGANASNTLDVLRADLTDLAKLSRATQFQISLARVQAAMVTQFADERFDIQDPELRDEANRAIKDLVVALVDGIDVTLEHVDALHSLMRRTRRAVTELTGEIREHGRLDALVHALSEFDDTYDASPLQASRQQLLIAAASLENDR